MTARVSFLDPIIRRLFQIALLLEFVTCAFAAPGDLDGTFGTSGIVVSDIGTEDRGSTMVPQSNGKLTVGGRSRLGRSFAFVFVWCNSGRQPRPDKQRQTRRRTFRGGVWYMPRSQQGCSAP